MQDIVYEGRIPSYTLEDSKTPIPLADNHLKQLVIKGGDPYIKVVAGFGLKLLIRAFVRPSNILSFYDMLKGCIAFNKAIK